MQHNITSRLAVEFQPGRTTTSVVLGLVDDDVYASPSYALVFQVFNLNNDFVKIGRKNRLDIRIFDDEVYTVEVLRFPDFVTEGFNPGALLILDIHEPPGGSIVYNPQISTVVRVTGGSARGKLKYTSHSNANLLSSFSNLLLFS